MYNSVKFCLDIDECAGNVCEQICVNTIGGYVCTCRPGFNLDGEECVGGSYFS